MEKNISQIVSEGLCTGCATCAGLCPKNAISMKITKGTYVPFVNEEKCLRCGLCYEVCPGFMPYPTRLQIENNGARSDRLVGSYVRCYVGHSSNLEVRATSSSGGLVTQLLIYALEKGIIDGALVTRMNSREPLHPEPFIATTKEEILSAAQTKYCPVPLNQGLSEILKRPGKFAMVGLPCHVQGARKAEQQNSKLKDRLILHFGLVCHHTPTFLATEYLLARLGLQIDEITKINYRGKGRPGKMSVFMKNGAVHEIDLYSSLYWGGAFSNFFFSSRCTLCADKMCEYADMTFMDAWLPEFSKNSEYESMVLSRSEMSDSLLQLALSEGAIEILKEVTAHEVVKAQDLYREQRRYSAQARLMGFLNRKVPYYCKPLARVTLADRLIAASVLLRSGVSERRRLWFLIDLVVKATGSTSSSN